MGYTFIVSVRELDNTKKEESKQFHSIDFSTDHYIARITAEMLVGPNDNSICPIKTSAFKLGGKTLDPSRIYEVEITTLEDGLPIHTELLGRLDTMPNGKESWAETHFEIVSEITRGLEDSEHPAYKVMEERGTGGLYELSVALTDEFERMHAGVSWDDGDWYSAIESFIINKFK